MAENGRRPIDTDPHEDRPSWMKEFVESDDDSTDDDGLEKILGRSSDD